MGIERFAESLTDPTFSLDDAKVIKCALVDAYSKQLLDSVVAKYSKAETSRWPILQSEALAYQASSTASVPTVTAEATYRKCDIPTLVQKILAKANAFNQLGSNIVGVNGLHTDAINALNDFDAIADYDFSVDWPEV